jgi:hypothetical protein
VLNAHATDLESVSMTRVTYFTNFFTRNGKIPEFQEEVVYCLKQALDSALTVNANVVISVIPDDYKVFAGMLGNSKNFSLRLLGSSSWKRRLPYIRDILQPSDDEDSCGHLVREEDYAIYANADICVPIYFFDFISQQIKQSRFCHVPSTVKQNWLSPDSIIINRRNISESSSSNKVHDYLEWHIGYDLFVFPYDFMNRFMFGNVSIGLPPVGALITLNLLYLSRRVLLINDLYITWHRGSDGDWEQAGNSESIQANYAEAIAAFKSMTSHDPSIITRLPYVGFEKALAMKSYEGYGVASSPQQDSSFLRRVSRRILNRLLR